MGKLKFNAGAAAAALRRLHGLPVLVAAAVDDGDDGVFIPVAYEMTVEEAELTAGTILRDIRSQLEEGEPGHCDACASRYKRVTEALEILERDGAKPTGQVRELQ